MDEKDKVNAYITLYKQQMDRFNSTQNLEWKANFGLWALLAGAAYFAAQKTLSVPRIPVVLILCCVVMVHSGWLRFIHTSEQIDRNLWTFFRRKAAEILQCDEGINQLLIQTKNRERLRLLVWMSFEIAMTIVLCMLLYAVLFLTRSHGDGI